MALTLRLIITINHSLINRRLTLIDIFNTQKFAWFRQDDRNCRVDKTSLIHHSLGSLVDTRCFIHPT